MMTTASKTRRTIGFVTEGFADFRFYGTWTGIADVVQERGDNLICFPVQDVKAEAKMAETPGAVLCDLINPARLDGLILHQWWDSQAWFERFTHRYQPLPMVTIFRDYPGTPGVLAANYQGMGAALRHLIDAHGCRRIAYLRGPEGTGADDRYRAYIDTLKACGIPYDPRLVLQGDHTDIFGAQAMNLLLDDGALRPGRDIEAVAASSDSIARGALRELQRRNIRVPDDVALVGFDGETWTAFTIPPLTTIAVPWYDIGRQAAEALYARFEGQWVSEAVIVPARVVIRHSCGCLDWDIRHAGGKHRARSTIPLDAACVKHRETMLAALRHAGGVALSAFPDGAERLLEACVTDITAPAFDAPLSGAFLPVLAEFLLQVEQDGGDAHIGHTIVSELRQQFRPYLTPQQPASERAEGLWQQSRVLISKLARQAQLRRQAQAEAQAARMRELGQRLISTFDVGALMDILADGLPRLGFPSAFLALYDDAKTRDRSHLMLAYTAPGRIEIEPQDRHFPSAHLLPDRLLDWDDPRHLVVEPLYFGPEPQGFLLLEIGPRDGHLSAILRGEISSALQGALLLTRIRERSAEIARQKYILDTFLDNVPDKIYFKDRHSRLTLVNNAYADMMGFDEPANGIGKSDFDFFAADVARIKYEQEQEIIRTGRPLVGVEEPDAEGQWALTTKMPLRDEHGDIIGTFGISRDITALKHAEQALRRLERAVETTDVGITIADPEGRIVYTNPAEAALHGYRVEELIGRKVHIFAARTPVPPPDDAADQVIWKRERWNRRKDGSEFPVRLLSNEIYDAGGQCIGRVTVCEDMTEPKRAEAALLAAHREVREKNRELAALNASKDTFFSIISHDLRSPFSTLMGFAHMLEQNFESFPPEQQLHYVTRIRESAERLYALLENLLNWAQLQRGAMPFAPEPLKLDTLLNECVALFEDKAAHKQVILRAELPEPLDVYADALMAQAIVRNLVSNALKFTPAGGTIRLSARARNAVAEIAVTDSGIGMPLAVQNQLFRSDTPYTTPGTAGERGTGLGLNLCQDMVAKHGGTITVESREGQGATFRFTLPLYVRCGAASQ